MIYLVVDASVAAKWWFPENGSAEAGLLRAEDVVLLAPDIILADMCSIVLQKVRRGQASERIARLALAALRDVPIRIERSDALVDEALSLALKHHPSAYDCLYAALAAQRECPLVTADQRFRSALARSDVESVSLGELPQLLAAARGSATDGDNG